MDNVCMAARGSQRFDSLSSSLLSAPLRCLILLRSLAFFRLEFLFPRLCCWLVVLAADSATSWPKIRFPVPPSCHRVDLILLAEIFQFFYQRTFPLFVRIFSDWAEVFSIVRPYLFLPKHFVIMCYDLVYLSYMRIHSLGLNTDFFRHPRQNGLFLLKSKNILLYMILMWGFFNIKNISNWKRESNIPSEDP